MMFALLTLFIAISISSVAAYYSIIGLMAIFAAAKIPIAIMGGVLEIGKLIVASWTFRNWKTSPLVMKFYFILAIVVLMLITSLGIFGFLSRAHLEQSSPSVLMEQKIERIDLKLNQKHEQLDRLETSVAALDAAFLKYLELGAVTKGLEAKNEQEDQLTNLKEQILTIEQEIDTLNDEKFDLRSQIRLSEVEVGPIRYVASLVYDSVDNSQLEDAVRWIIILLILVFDPLAVVLVIAGNISLQQVKAERERRNKRKEKQRKQTVSLPNNKKAIDSGNIHEFNTEDTQPNFKFLSWSAFNKMKQTGEK